MKRLLFIILCSIWVLLTMGCSKSLVVEDVQKIDVYYDQLPVTSIDDADTLREYYEYLMSSPSVATDLEGDLVYNLEVQTIDALLTYQLIFNRQQKKALAVSPSGSYEMPYSLLDDYLTLLPIPEAFDYNNPPSMILSIDGYTMAYGYNQTWHLHPTENVDYTSIVDHSHSENYKSTTTDLVIRSDFGLSAPDKLSLKIVGIQNSDLYDQVDKQLLPVPKEEGAYRYELTGIWFDNGYGYSGTITYFFGVSISLPEAFSLNDSTYEPGDCMAIIIRSPKSLDYRVETDTFKKTIGLFYMEDDLVGLIPLNSRTEPGDYQVNIYTDSKDILLESIDYTVLPKLFDSQQLTVSGNTASLKSDDNYAKDAAKFGDAKAYSIGEKLWEGTFLQPVQGRISTEYSMIRYINNGKESSRHSGLDIAAPKGTEVLAANNGIVTFASDLIVSGNVIVLDHGYGLFTSYVHLDKIYVEDGQTVGKGDVIGAVGSTGYSTGPHLHWTVWKNGVYLNPWKFIAEDPLAVFTD